MVHLDLRGSLWKQKSFEVKFGTQTEWEDCAVWQAATSRRMEQWNWKSVRQKISSCVYELSKASPVRIGGCVMFGMSLVKPKGMGLDHREADVSVPSKWRLAKLQSCNHSGILQPANGVHLKAVLCGLAFVSSERVVLHCSEPSAVDIYTICSAGRPAETELLNWRKAARQMLLIGLYMPNHSLPV